MIKRTAGLFACGSIGYTVLELLWRGYSHWTMALTGGIVFSIMAPMRRQLQGVSIMQRCIAGSVFITTTEFIVGCVVNLHYGLRVWDYSHEKLNLRGQICAKYAILWFLLAAPAMRLSKSISGFLENT